MNRGAWWATVHGITKESDKAQQLNNSNKDLLVPSYSLVFGCLVVLLSLSFTLAAFLCQLMLFHSNMLLFLPLYLL